MTKKLLKTMEKFNKKLKTEGFGETPEEIAFNSWKIDMYGKITDVWGDIYRNSQSKGGETKCQN